MKAEAFFDAVRALPTGQIDDLTAGHAFVVLAPHPDDESLGTGGLIAGARERGTRVDIVVATDGSGSHTHSARYPREALSALRRREAIAAGSFLDVGESNLTFLDLPDAGAPTSGREFDDAVDRIGRVVRNGGAKSLFVTWRHDPHCDHEAAAAMAHAVRLHNPGLSLWAYSIWGWHLDPETDVDCTQPRGFKIDVTRWRGRKLAAIQAHASQMSGLIDDDPNGFQMTEAQLMPFTGPFEYFFEIGR